MSLEDLRTKPECDPVPMIREMNQLQDRIEKHIKTAKGRAYLQKKVATFFKRRIKFDRKYIQSTDLKLTISEMEQTYKFDKSCLNLHRRLQTIQDNIFLIEKKSPKELTISEKLKLIYNILLVQALSEKLLQSIEGKKVSDLLTTRSLPIW